jgi:pyruvate dehydrogenase E2 component (dihydrolipoyllysine-residue acetyltransferase)
VSVFTLRRTGIFATVPTRTLLQSLAVKPKPPVSPATAIAPRPPVALNLDVIPPPPDRRAGWKYIGGRWVFTPTVEQPVTIARPAIITTPPPTPPPVLRFAEPDRPIGEPAPVAPTLTKFSTCSTCGQEQMTDVPAAPAAPAASIASPAPSAPAPTPAPAEQPKPPAPSKSGAVWLALGALVVIGGLLIMAAGARPRK